MNAIGQMRNLLVACFAWRDLGCARACGQNAKILKFTGNQSTPGIAEARRSRGAPRRA